MLVLCMLKSKKNNTILKQITYHLQGEIDVESIVKIPIFAFLLKIK